MADKIRLWTGYEVEVEEGWEQHLVNALIGEIMVGSFKSGAAESWDDALRMMLTECDRLSRVYKLHLSALLVRVFASLDKVLRNIQDAPKMSDKLTN
jgi:hypothetical protein